MSGFQHHVAVFKSLWPDSALTNCYQHKNLKLSIFFFPLCVPGIFGQKLEETVRYERRFGNKLAPMLVEQCVDFIRQWGLREEGLFRLPGQANLVKELQDAFDCGEKPSFDW